MAIVPESFLEDMGRARTAVREIAPLRYRFSSQVSVSPLVVTDADGRAETYVPDQTMDC
jgi:hypothetical protein